MAVYEVFFDDCIFDAYHEICKHLFDHDLKKLYIPSGQVPEPPDSWVSAFKCKLLKSLNLDAESFKFKLGLWRALNLDYLNKKKKIRMSKTVLLPLPPTETYNPLTHSTWDAFKGGGDTITKLIDNVQERVGIRTDNNVAAARLLV